MTKPKAEKGKKQDKAHADDQPLPELADLANATASVSGKDEPETGTESNILSAIRCLSKTMTHRLSTSASLVSLGNCIKEVENASSEYDRRLSLVEQTCTKITSENEALRLKVNRP